MGSGTSQTRDFLRFFLTSIILWPLNWQCSKHRVLRDGGTFETDWISTLQGQSWKKSCQQWLGFWLKQKPLECCPYVLSKSFSQCYLVGALSYIVRKSCKPEQQWKKVSAKGDLDVCVGLFGFTIPALCIFILHPFVLYMDQEHQPMLILNLLWHFENNV